MADIYDIIVKDQKGNDVTLKEYEGKVLVCKVNVDQSSIAAKYGIQSIPVVMAIKDGTELGRVIGNYPAKVRDLLNLLK